MSLYKMLKREKSTKESPARDTRWDRIRKRFTNGNSVTLKSEAVRRFMGMNFIGKNERFLKTESVGSLNPQLVMDIRHEMFKKIPKKLPLATVATKDKLKSCINHNLVVEEHMLENELNKLRQQLENNHKRNKLNVKIKDLLKLDNGDLIDSFEETTKHIEEFYSTPIRAMQDIENLCSAEAATSYHQKMRFEMNTTRGIQDLLLGEICMETESVKSCETGTDQYAALGSEGFPGFENIITSIAEKEKNIGANKELPQTDECLTQRKRVSKNDDIDNITLQKELDLKNSKPSCNSGNRFSNQCNKKTGTEKKVQKYIEPFDLYASRDDLLVNCSKSTVVEGRTHIVAEKTKQHMLKFHTLSSDIRKDRLTSGQYEALASDIVDRSIRQCFDIDVDDRFLSTIKDYDDLNGYEKTEYQETYDDFSNKSDSSIKTLRSPISYIVDEAFAKALESAKREIRKESETQAQELYPKQGSVHNLSDLNQGSKNEDYELDQHEDHQQDRHEFRNKNLNKVQLLIQNEVGCQNLHELLPQDEHKTKKADQHEFYVKDQYENQREDHQEAYLKNQHKVHSSIQHEAQQRNQNEYKLLPEDQHETQHETHQEDQEKLNAQHQHEAHQSNQHAADQEKLHKHQFGDQYKDQPQETHQEDQSKLPLKDQHETHREKPKAYLTNQHIPNPQEQPEAILSNQHEVDQENLDKHRVGDENNDHPQETHKKYQQKSHHQEQLESQHEDQQESHLLVRNVHFDKDIAIRSYCRENSSGSNTSDDLDSIISDLAEEALLELQMEAKTNGGEDIKEMPNEIQQNALLLPEELSLTDENSDEKVQAGYGTQTVGEDMLLITKLQLPQLNKDNKTKPDEISTTTTTAEDDDDDEKSTPNQEQQKIIQQLFQPRSNRNIEILRKYFLKWMHFTTIQKIERENCTVKHDRIRKINVFLDKIRIEKRRIIHARKQCNNEDDEEPKDKERPVKGMVQMNKKYQNKIKMQQDIIDLQRLKLERQERLIMELKLHKLSDEAKEARQELKQELKSVMRSGESKAKAKAKCLQLIGNLRDAEDEEMARLQGKALLQPKFLQKMQERALERSVRHEQARQRRLQKEAEREAQKIAAEEAKRLEDEEAKRMRIEYLNEKRRQEKMAKILKERERQRAIENNRKAQEFHRRLLLKRVGMEGFKRLLQLKRENRKKCEALRRKILQRTYFIAWRDHYKFEMSQKITRADNLYQKILKRNAFAAWRLYVEDEHSKYFVAVDWYDLKLSESVFVRWLKYTREMKKIEEVKMLQAKAHHEWHLKWKVMDCWQRLPQILQLEKETEERRQRWRMKIWELLPDYKPNRDSLWQEPLPRI